MYCAQQSEHKHDRPAKNKRIKMSAATRPLITAIVAATNVGGDEARLMVKNGRKIGHTVFPKETRAKGIKKSSNTKYSCGTRCQH